MNFGARLWIQILALLLTKCVISASYLSSVGLNFVIFKNGYNQGFLVKLAE